MKLGWGWDWGWGWAEVGVGTEVGEVGGCGIEVCWVGVGGVGLG